VASKEQQVEFGDFQTPLPLAVEVCQTLVRLGVQPVAAIEPTCGRGAFVAASLQCFPQLQRAIGLDRNPAHLSAARRSIKNASFMKRDFFKANWQKITQDLPQPLLVIGNPPWVTNTQLSLLDSSNVPVKSNQGMRGMDAITGRSNFDISEWMILRMLDWLEGTPGTLAMLCKTKVARRVLEQAWQASRKIGRCSIFTIDAAKHFQVTVDACLLLCEFGKRNSSTAAVYANLDAKRPHAQIGLSNIGQSKNGDQIRKLVSNVRLHKSAADCARNLSPAEHGSAAKDNWVWRSGIKHDCSSVMELISEGRQLKRQTGKTVDLEPRFLFPLLKGSQVANGLAEPNRRVIVTQRKTGDDTKTIARKAPRTWKYLLKHGKKLDARRSSIYKNRPRFSVFGIGDYAFTPWKIAIAGLYKKLEFRLVGPYRRKPVLFDDTTYFLPCPSREIAEDVLEILNSERVQQFFLSQVFWDEKRPITSDLLNRLDISRLLREHQATQTSRNKSRKESRRNKK
jgi:hypothetical protein